VNISAKTEYACIAILELACQYESDQPVQVRKIADKHGIPSRFLVQILLQLKGAGLVSSTRGVSGGYRLAQAPRQITLGQVMGAIDGGSQDPVSNTGLETPVSRALLDAWCSAGGALRKTLDSVTFADLAESVRAPAGTMYYI
jgi:Rrf2 family protein